MMRPYIFGELNEYSSFKPTTLDSELVDIKAS